LLSDKNQAAALLAFKAFVRAAQIGLANWRPAVTNCLRVKLGKHHSTTDDANALLRKDAKKLAVMAPEDNWPLAVQAATRVARQKSFFISGDFKICSRRREETHSGIQDRDFPKEVEPRHLHPPQCCHGERGGLPHRNEMHGSMVVDLPSSLVNMVGQVCAGTGAEARFRKS